MHSYSDPNYSRRVRKAILTLGRQPDSDIIVLSPSIHVNDNGEIIPFEDSNYVWVDSIAKKEGIVPSGTTFLRSLPKCEQPLDSLLEGLQELTQDNFISAVFVLGRSIDLNSCCPVIGNRYIP